MTSVLIRTIATASTHYFGHATLNQPGSLNALTLDMVQQLDPALAHWAADPQCAGVLLDGAGEKAFCAGGDVVSMARAIKAQPSGTVPTMCSDFFEAEYRMDYRIHRFPKPLMVWGHGITMGGGIGLLAGASHRVATERTRLAMPEIAIGLYPDVGGSWFLSRMPGGIGAFLALTAAALNAHDARFIGLADFIVPHAHYASVQNAIHASAWSGNCRNDAAQLSHLLALHAPNPTAHTALAPSPLRAHFDTIQQTIGHDRLSDIAGRLEALAQHPDPWLAAAGTAFLKGAPTSAALGLKLQRRARHMALADVFRMEYIVSGHCCMGTEFAEGVRALLIDKDRTPHWQPDRLEALDPAHINRHFAPWFDGPHPLADLA